MAKSYRYSKKMKLLSGKSWIENENKEKVFYSAGSYFCDAIGNTLYKIEVEKKFLRKKTIYIKQMDGILAATIKKTGFFSASDWKIEIPDRPDMSASAGIISSYTIDSKGTEIAKIWDTGIFRKGYDVRIKSGQNDALILAITEVLSPIYVKAREEAKEEEREWERWKSEQRDRQRDIL